MKITTGLEGRKGRIELIPLLDVIFQVLVFFMYSTLFMTSEKSFDIALPKGRGGEAVQTELVFVIDRDDRVFLNSAQVALETAGTEATRALKHLPSDTPVVIRADRDARLGTGVSLMSVLRDEGISLLRFETDGEL